MLPVHRLVNTSRIALISTSICPSHNCHHHHLSITMITISSTIISSPSSASPASPHCHHHHQSPAVILMIVVWRRVDVPESVQPANSVVLQWNPIRATAYPLASASPSSIIHYLSAIIHHQPSAIMCHASCITQQYYCVCWYLGALIE